jgi:hypothetical protein
MRRPALAQTSALTVPSGPVVMIATGRPANVMAAALSAAH